MWFLFFFPFVSCFPLKHCALLLCTTAQAFVLHKLAMRSRSVVWVSHRHRLSNVSAVWQRYGLDKAIAPELLTTAQEQRPPLTVVVPMPQPPPDSGLSPVPPVHVSLDVQPAGVHRELSQDVTKVVAPATDLVYRSKFYFVEQMARLPPLHDLEWVRAQIASYPFVLRNPDAPRDPLAQQQNPAFAKAAAAAAAASRSSAATVDPFAARLAPPPSPAAAASKQNN
jgi:hypothetical protein